VTPFNGIENEASLIIMEASKKSFEYKILIIKSENTYKVTERNNVIIFRAFN